MPLEQETPESFITGIVTENVIFAILSERKLGPRLMGVFAGGRLEEYIPVILKRFTQCLKKSHFSISLQAKSLSSSQFRKKAISHAISRKMARIHKLNVPINTDARWIFKSLEK